MGYLPVPQTVGVETLKPLVADPIETFHSDLWPRVEDTFSEAAVQLRVPRTYFSNALLTLEQVAAGLEDFRLLGKRGMSPIRAPRLP